MMSAEKNADSERAVPQTELACVVLHAGETADVNYLRDYIQVVEMTDPITFEYSLQTITLDLGNCYWLPITLITMHHTGSIHGIQIQL